MAPKRTGYAPYSLTREAGVQSATVNGTIDVIQEIRPVIDSGFLDERGNWQGRNSDDEVFIGLTKAEAIPNGATVLFPDTAEHNKIDMTGYSDLMIAFKPTRAGNVATLAIQGPDTNSFANLSPVNAGETLRGTGTKLDREPNSLVPLYEDTSQSLTNDVWTIFFVSSSLRGQKNLQISVTNNAGGNSDIEFGFMRLV